MFNSSIDAYGSVRRLAAVQNVASSQSALGASASKPVVKDEAVQQAEVDTPTLVAAVKKLNEHVAPALQTVEFALEESANNRVIVKVVDTVTKRVLRQIPNEEVLAFSKTMDRLQGLVIRQTA